MRDVQPIIDEIHRLADERRARLATAADVPRAADGVAHVDLRDPVPIPQHHPLRGLLALADRLRRRLLQAILIRQSEFNRQTSTNLALLSARFDDVERDRATEEDTLEALRARVVELDARVGALHRLEDARRASADGAHPAGSDPGAPAPPPATPRAVYRDPLYARLEAQMRGDEATIRERQRPYVDLFADDGAPILDVGCGRGEFLELLCETGRVARGIDLCPENVRRCVDKGLDVVEAEAIEYLATVANGSLGGVFGSHFIEHVPTEYFLAFARACFAKLRPTGRLVLETINADALATLPTFYADPTHVRPIPPGTAKLVLEACGFRPVEIRYTSPFPAQTRLSASAGDSPLAQRFDDAVEKLNQVLFGAREYAVIATR
jgi:2-polyprenyl-3-methyl-5-hydroxy-6-metoxy-1,4-benzoquinol methylase